MNVRRGELHLFELGHDVIRTVFEYLRPSDLYQVRIVCKWFLELAPLINWDEILKSRFGGHPNLNSLFPNMPAPSISSLGPSFSALLSAILASPLSSNTLAPSSSSSSSPSSSVAPASHTTVSSRSLATSKFIACDGYKHFSLDISIRTSDSELTPLGRAVKLKNQSILNRCYSYIKDNHYANITPVSEKFAIPSYGDNALLHWAVCCNQLDEINAFLNSPAFKKSNINVLNAYGVSALYSAAECGHTEVATALLKVKIVKTKKIIIDKRNADGNTPLLIAIIEGNEACANLLIEHNANIKLLNKHYETALHLAAEKSLLSLMPTLIQKGLPVNPRSLKPLQTPLQVALCYGSELCIQFLLENGADITVNTLQNNTPLHLAAERGLLSFAKLFIEKGLNIGVRNYSDETPLILAIKANKIDMVKFLLDRGAYIEVCKSESIINDAKRLKQTEIVSLLIRQKWINFLNITDQTPTVCKEMAGYVKTNHIDIDDLSNKYFAPIHMAASLDHVEFVKALILELTKSIKQTDHNIMLVDPVISAEVNQSTIYNETPLHIAAYHGSINALLFLLKNGASINIQNSAKLTPLDVARQQGHTPIVRILAKLSLLAYVEKTRVCVDPILSFAANFGFHSQDHQDTTNARAQNYARKILVIVKQYENTSVDEYLKQLSVFEAQQSDEKFDAELYGIYHGLLNDLKKEVTAKMHSQISRVPGHK